MPFSPYSLLGALIFLIVGILDMALMRRFLYPPLRRRFETLKVTARQGADPMRVMNVLWFLNLVVLPVIGFFAGNQIFGR